MPSLSAAAPKLQQHELRGVRSVFEFLFSTMATMIWKFLRGLGYIDAYMVLIQDSLIPRRKCRTAYRSSA